MVGENFRRELMVQKESIRKEDVVGVVLGEIAVNRDIEIPSEFVAFVKAVIDQSFDFRQEEWAAYPMKLIRLRVEHVLRDVMRAARTYSVPHGKPVLSLTSVLESIKNQWCGVYPIC